MRNAKPYPMFVVSFPRDCYASLTMTEFFLAPYGWMFRQAQHDNMEKLIFYAPVTKTHSGRTYTRTLPIRSALISILHHYIKRKTRAGRVFFGALCAIARDFELSDIFVEFFFDVGKLLHFGLFDDVAAQNDHLRIAQGFKVFERIAGYNHEVCGFSHFD